MYFPEYGSRRLPAGAQSVAGDDGTVVSVLHLPNPTARFTVWYFHGNAEDLGDVEPFLRALQAEGFAVFAFDYPGYGHSTGRPSERAVYEAARRARRYLREQLGVPAEKTILLGRSLGGGPATQMAIEEPIAGLVLQSAFTSAFRVVTRVPLLPFDPYVNVRKLPRLRAPVLIMHGDRDEVIPFHHGQALFAAAHEPKRALWISGAQHNDLVAVAGARYWTALRDFSELCAATQAGATDGRPR